jgi:hypothetical protein
MACAMVTLRDMDTAIELLESVVVSAAPQGLRWFETDNSLDPIREDPRYQALVANAKARLGMNE